LTTDKTLKTPKPPKKNVRRKSNWYIYLISFAATSVLLSLLVLAFWDRLFPERKNTVVAGQGIYGYVPGEELNINILFMLSRDKGAVPDYFMLMNYRPRDEKIVLIPLKPETYVSSGGASGKLTDVYKSGGSENVISGVEAVFGLKIGHYVKFDKTSFINFIAMFGDVPVNIPFDLAGTEGGSSFSAGMSPLSGAELYEYITFPKYGNENEDYRLVVMGSVFAALIKNNTHDIISEKIQSTFNKIINTADTDMTFKDFLTYQQALIYNSENGFDTPTYYVPFGEYNENGAYVTSEESVGAILSKFKV